jgi:hypothetical protein
LKASQAELLQKVRTGLLCSPAEVGFITGRIMSSKLGGAALSSTVPFFAVVATWLLKPMHRSSRWTMHSLLDFDGGLDLEQGQYELPETLIFYRGEKEVRQC